MAQVNLQIKDANGVIQTVPMTQVGSALVPNNIITDPTNSFFLPTMDVAGRAGYMKVTDGTNVLGMANVVSGTQTAVPTAGVGAIATYMPDNLLTVATGTKADPAALSPDSSSPDAAGSIVAQLRAVNRSLQLLQEQFRGWKKSELSLLSSLVRIGSGQVGAWMPSGGNDDTDGLGDDLAGGSSM